MCNVFIFLKRTPKLYIFWVLQNLDLPLWGFHRPSQSLGSGGLSIFTSFPLDIPASCVLGHCVGNVHTGYSGPDWIKPIALMGTQSWGGKCWPSGLLLGHPPEWSVAGGPLGTGLRGSCLTEGWAVGGNDLAPRSFCELIVPFNVWTTSSG